MLYEPTNIIPSIITQTGTIASADPVSVQWQVNGTSPMSAFQIDVYLDNADSTFVHSTGVITAYPESGANNLLPFYGKDRLGEYVPFTYTPTSTTWASWGLTDGNNYKFVITQFFTLPVDTYAANNTITVQSGQAGTAYFSYAKGGTTYYPTFTIYNPYSSATAFRPYFCDSNQTGWVTYGETATSGVGSSVLSSVTYSLNTSAPTDGATNLGTGVDITNSGVGSLYYNQQFVAQNTPSALITRSEPTLSINSFGEETGGTVIVDSSVMSFGATYMQGQGDSINSVRWQMFNANDLNNAIDDTGTIYTPILSYEYNGLFDNQSYVVSCTVTTVNGQTVTQSQRFTVDYSVDEYAGEVSVGYVCSEDSVLLSWAQGMAIPGVVTPADSYTISNSIISLNSGATLTWNQQITEDGEQQALSIATPWTAIWRSSYMPQVEVSYVGEVDNDLASTTVNTTAFVTVGSNNYLLVGTTSDVYCRLYQVNSGNSYSYLGTLQREGQTSSGEVNSIAVHTYTLDGVSTVIIAVGGYGEESGWAYVAEFDGTVNLQNVQDITLRSETSSTAIYAVAFNHRGSALCVCGHNDGIGIAELFETSFSSTGFSVGSSFDLTQSVSFYRVYCAAFSPNDNALVVGGYYRWALSNDEKVAGYHITYNSDGGINQIIGQDYGGLVTALYTTCYSLYFESNTRCWAGGSFGVVSLSINTASNSVITGDSHLISGTDVRSFSMSSNGACIAMANESANGLDLLCGNFTHSTGYTAALSGFGYAPPFNCYTVNFVPDSSYCLIGGSRGLQILNFDWVEQTELLRINNGGENEIILGREFNTFYLQVNDVIEQYLTLPFGTPEYGYFGYTVTIAPTGFRVYAYELDSEGVEDYFDSEADIDIAQSAISSVQLIGEQECEYTAVVSGSHGSSSSVYQYTSSTFKPSWSSGEDETQLFADFNSGLSAGISSGATTGYRIYRTETDSDELTEVITLTSNRDIPSIRDFAVKSGTEYHYVFFAYDSNNNFMGQVTTDNVKSLFNKYSLLATEYSDTDHCYHVVKEYLFSCNLSDEALSNNAQKSYVQNFTPYPTVFRSTANYASGTLQALIGFVDKKTYRYWDDTALMAELNGLSTTDYTLFLRDMKGHLWLVDVGTVQQTVKYGTREMQVTISLPWTEIGDASDVSIVQTPEDEGWNYDAQVLDVKLDVNVETGNLQVVYPFPYNGTAFYLVGVTPQGVISTVQPLPTSADEPISGQLKALVRHK